MVLPWPEPHDPEKEPAGGYIYCSVATCPWRSLMEAVKDWMSLSKSTVVGSTMGDDMESVEVWMVRLGW
jgi:hypothetical protein